MYCPNVLSKFTRFPVTNPFEMVPRSHMLVLPCVPVQGRAPEVRLLYDVNHKYAGPQHASCNRKTAGRKADQR